MTSLQTVIRDVERFSISDVVRYAELSLLPCDCADPDTLEFRVIEQYEPIKTECMKCGRRVVEWTVLGYTTEEGL